ncbi:hypothetical protein CTEN210_02081 [Chaetoceros tenuissimus]|uniref:AAA+ ATPase domain-containing protein n=1 Tax=Chaetoceros tenuissimus TaxID=426638 RepID=A0AAD3CGD1_9STRA|nr:hypothetical protein CTEN210_02081 [Chaetoceros tenuissimus]
MGPNVNDRGSDEGTLFYEIRSFFIANKDLKLDENDTDTEKKFVRRNRVRNGTIFFIFLICFRYWSRKGNRRRISFGKLLPPALLGSTKSQKKVLDNRYAVETPISVLLSSAKRGSVFRAAMNSSYIIYELKGGEQAKPMLKKSLLPSNNPSFASDIAKTLTENGCLDLATIPDPLLTRMLPILLTLSPFIYLILLYRMMKNLHKGGDSDFKSTSSDDMVGNEKRVTFDDVAGIENQIELEEVVAYLKDPRPFQKLGAKPPRGILLHGPSGCGKTLLAKAVAGEADADYFVGCSGSDFCEIFVGQGSLRVRKLFSNARSQALMRWQKKYGDGKLVQTKRLVHYTKTLLGLGSRIPFRTGSVENPSNMRPPTAVLFIDEIDSVARARDGTLSGFNNDEREQTLNALLTEMDGFQEIGNQRVNVIVIAATNRLAVLDPAITRPGRFDRHVEVLPPNEEGRYQILKIHARKIKLDESVDLKMFALDEMSDGFTGADIQNLINEAALFAVRERKQCVQNSHLMMATKRIQSMKYI